MKILIISDAWHPQINGVVRTYEHLIAQLESEGHEIRILGPGDFPFQLPLPGYPEIRLALFAGRKLRKEICSFQPDAIHIATEGPLGSRTLRYCKRSKLAFTTAYHTRFPDYIAKRTARYFPFLQNTAYKYALGYLRRFHNASSLIFTATPSLEEDLKQTAFTTPFYRLTRGVDLEIFTPEGRRANIKSPRPVALYVGRIALEKNLQAFLDAPWQGSKILIGDGPSLAGLRASYPDAIFPGPRTGEDLASFYRAADIFVFPSQTDTFGIVLIEALACGIPVAAYPAMGPKDILTEASLGALDADLGVAMKKALEVARRFSHQDRRAHVQKLYSWEMAGRQFLSGLETLPRIQPLFSGKGASPKPKRD